ncbi:hypothetical protein BKA58DRAFT_417586 [Alternaria rosae]|uniref:uncharacterized protein n=1 Tax=Alternaria rosae TaxID=1187941 RepID=UPI001E8D84EA|nr:uncharacterized protein BKA58DRAFT_417586 [Alternaria rosae]KAH6877980.1 hypothetical protein BKA58DRAFT_417586 [Alternaria rosae]
MPVTLEVKRPYAASSKALGFYSCGGYDSGTVSAEHLSQAIATEVRKMLWNSSCEIFRGGCRNSGAVSSTRRLNHAARTHPKSLKRCSLRSFERGMIISISVQITKSANRRWAMPPTWHARLNALQLQTLYKDGFQVAVRLTEIEKHLELHANDIKSCGRCLWTSMVPSGASAGEVEPYPQSSGIRVENTICYELVTLPRAFHPVASISKQHWIVWADIHQKREALGVWGVLYRDPWRVADLPWRRRFLAARHRRCANLRRDEVVEARFGEVCGAPSLGVPKVCYGAGTDAFLSRGKSSADTTLFLFCSCTHLSFVTHKAEHGTVTFSRAQCGQACIYSCPL